MRNYLLIHTEPKEVSRVAREIATIPGVISAEPVSGQYDVIAEVEARSLDAFARTTLHEIQSVDDVVRTITCAVSGHDRLWEEHVEPGPRGPRSPSRSRGVPVSAGAGATRGGSRLRAGTMGVEGSDRP